MEQMFCRSKKFDEDIGGWDTSKVKNMQKMFFGAEKFNKDINHWNVSNVTNMQRIFSRTKLFNKPLNRWQVQKVDKMENMFHLANAYFQDMSNYNWKPSCSLVLTNRYIDEFFNPSKFNSSFYPPFYLELINNRNNNNDGIFLPNSTNCTPSTP